MPRCSIIGCGTNSGRRFRFPHALNKPEDLRVWIHNVNRKNWSPTENSVVCYKHFVDQKPTAENPYPILNMGWNYRAANRRAKLAVDRSLATARQQTANAFNLWSSLDSIETDSSELVADKANNNRKRGRPKKPFPETSLKLGKNVNAKMQSVGKQWPKPRKISKLQKGYVLPDSNENGDKKASYVCHMCETDFLFEAQYKSHNINCALQSSNESATSTTSSTIAYQCTSCDKIYSSLVDYLKHYSKSDANCVDTSSKTRLAAWDTCVCFLCGFATRRSTLTDHLRVEHRDRLRRPNDDNYFEDCQLCSQRSSLTKSGAFLSPLEFLNHLSLRHPAAVVLLKSVKSEPLETIEKTVSTVASVAKEIDDFMICRICNVDVLKSAFDDHVLIQHCGEYEDPSHPKKQKRLLFDPALRKRRRVDSPPPPLTSAYFNADRELTAKHCRKRSYRWIKENGNHCRGCGWTAGNRTEYFIHVLCNLCKPESDEFNVRMKCPLCYVVANRSEILTHLCRMHEHQLGLSFDKSAMDSNYENEGLLAKEIIGYEWRCRSCCVGFYRRAFLTHHKCHSKNESEPFALCAICRVSLKNDILLKLHHRFEHEDARSGLQEPCGDPISVYSAIETKAHVVQNHTQLTTSRLQNKKFSQTLYKPSFETPASFCICGARFNSPDVHRLHKEVFHSKFVNLPPKMLEIMTDLYKMPFVSVSAKFMSEFLKRSCKPFAEKNIPHTVAATKLHESLPSNKKLVKCSLPSSQRLHIESPRQVQQCINGLTVTSSTIDAPSVPIQHNTVMPKPISLHNEIGSSYETVSFREILPQPTTTTSNFGFTYPKKKSFKTPVLVKTFSLAKNPSEKTADAVTDTVSRLAQSVTIHSSIVTDSSETEFVTKVDSSVDETAAQQSTPTKLPTTYILEPGYNASTVNRPKFITILNKPLANVSRSSISMDESTLPDSNATMRLTSSQKIQAATLEPSNKSLVAVSNKSFVSASSPTVTSSNHNSKMSSPYSLFNAIKLQDLNSIPKNISAPIVSMKNSSSAGVSSLLDCDLGGSLGKEPFNKSITVPSLEELSAPIKSATAIVTPVFTDETPTTSKSPLQTSQKHDFVGRILQQQVVNRQVGREPFGQQKVILYPPTVTGSAYVMTPVSIPAATAAATTGKYFIRTPQTTITLVKGSRFSPPQAQSSTRVQSSSTIESHSNAATGGEDECILLD